MNPRRTSDLARLPAQDVKGGSEVDMWSLVQAGRGSLVARLRLSCLIFDKGFVWTTHNGFLEA